MTETQLLVSGFAGLAVLHLSVVALMCQLHLHTSKRLDATTGRIDTTNDHHVTTNNELSALRERVTGIETHVTAIEKRLDDGPTRPAVT